MRYWIQRGAGQPEELTVDRVVHAFKLSQIGWDTPACEVGAATWTSVGRVPALVAASHVAEPPQHPVAPSPPPGPLARIKKSFDAINKLVVELGAKDLANENGVIGAIREPHGETARTGA